MKRFLLTLVFVLLFCLQSAHVQAAQNKSILGTYLFGRREEIGEIQGLAGTDYKLGHKYTLYFFIAGIYLSDDGYVLQDKGAFKTYHPLSEKEIKELQASGTLPSPMPGYSISIWSYLFGYSLWIVLAFSIAAPSLRRLALRLIGIRFCPSCKLELTPHESKARICGVCNAPLRGSVGRQQAPHN